MKDIEFYLESISRELMKCKDSRFTGNIEFQVNFKDGSIANMNLTQHKSIRKPIETHS